MPYAVIVYEHGNLEETLSLVVEQSGMAELFETEDEAREYCEIIIDGAHDNVIWTVVKVG